MKCLAQRNNLKIVHDQKGTGSVFVLSPRGVRLEEFRTASNGSLWVQKTSLARAVCKATAFCLETTDYATS